MRLVCIEPGKSGYECIEPNQNVHWDGLGTRLVCIIASFTGKGKNAWFQPFAHARNFPRNLGNHVILVFFRVRITHNHVILVFFRVMATCSNSDDEFSSALVLYA